MKINFSQTTVCLRPKFQAFENMENYDEVYQYKGSVWKTDQRDFEK